MNEGEVVELSLKSVEIPAWGVETCIQVVTNVVLFGSVRCAIEGVTM